MIVCEGLDRLGPVAGMGAVGRRVAAVGGLVGVAGRVDGVVVDSLAGAPADSADCHLDSAS